MTQSDLTFHLATNYLSRIALRLEELFLAVEQARAETGPLLHHYALKNFIDILKVVEKPELKSRFIQEFMRIDHSINKSLFKIPEKLYAKLFLHIQKLNSLAGNFGDLLHDDPFLESFRFSSSSTLNECELHAPQLLFWLENNASARQAQLKFWQNKLHVLYETVSLYMSLLRSSAQFERITLEDGFYQKSLSSKISSQLILVRMNKNAKTFPKIQLGHHNLSLRLYELSTMQEVSTVSENAELAICHI